MKKYSYKTNINRKNRTSDKKLTPEEKKRFFPFLDDEKLKCSPDGRLTFVGVMAKYFDEISKNWNAKDNTLKPYANEYVTALLALDNAVAKANGRDPDTINKKNLLLPLEDYSGDIFFAALDHIQKSSRQGVPSKERMDDYLRHYRRVVETAAKHGVCPNFLYGTQRSRKQTGKKEKLAKLILPKSLSPRMNALIFQSLTSAPENMKGEWMGLFLMYAFGLRNNESVGVCYEDFDNVRNYEILWILKFAKGYKRTDKKAKGKTINAFRGIPATEKAAEVIRTRRKYIEAHVAAQHPDWDEDRVKTTVDEYPIACHGKEYDKGITPAQLTDAGRDFFSRINCEDFDEDDFYLAHIAALDPEYMARIGFDYKDPTAYLLRREFGTTLKILGFSKEEREFLMGHLIEEGEFMRNDYLNSPMLREMDRKMKQRPLHNTIKENPIVVTHYQTPNEQMVMPNDVFRIQADERRHILVAVKAIEPCDIHFSTEKAVTSQQDAEFLSQNNDDPAIVISVYQRVMTAAYDNLTSKSNEKQKGNEERSYDEDEGLEEVPGNDGI